MRQDLRKGTFSVTILSKLSLVKCHYRIALNSDFFFFLYEILMQKHTGWTGSIIQASMRVLPGNTDKHLKDDRRE